MGEAFGAEVGVLERTRGSHAQRCTTSCPKRTSWPVMDENDSKHVPFSRKTVRNINRRHGTFKGNEGKLTLFSGTFCHASRTRAGASHLSAGAWRPEPRRGRSEAKLVRNLRVPTCVRLSSLAFTPLTHHSAAAGRQSQKTEAPIQQNGHFPYEKWRVKRGGRRGP